MTILKNGLKIEVTNNTNNEQLNYIEAFNFYNLKNKENIDKEDKESLNYIDTGDKECFKKCQKYDIIKIKVNNDILGTTEVIDTEVLRDDAGIPFIRIYCGVLYKNLEKPLGKMIGTHEEYTKALEMFNNIICRIKNHEDSISYILEDAPYHQSQEFLKADRKKQEAVLKKSEHIVKEIKDLMIIINANIHEFE